MKGWLPRTLADWSQAARALPVYKERASKQKLTTDWLCRGGDAAFFVEIGLNGSR